MSVIPTISRDKNKVLGNLGEEIVLDRLKRFSNLNNIHLSYDLYDSEKDIVFGDGIVEVKTQVPFISKKAFTIRPNQLQKCLNVDHLFFVPVHPDRQSILNMRFKEESSAILKIKGFPNLEQNDYTSMKNVYHYIWGLRPKKRQPGYERLVTKDGREMYLFSIDHLFKNAQLRPLWRLTKDEMLQLHDLNSSTWSK